MRLLTQLLERTSASLRRRLQAYLRERRLSRTPLAFTERSVPMRICCNHLLFVSAEVRALHATVNLNMRPDIACKKRIP